MPALDLAVFTGARDEEASRYHVLHGLQQVRRAFASNHVYPHLADLIHLRTALCEISDRSDQLRERGPLTEIDLEEGTLRYEESGRPMLFEDLIAWALPRIEAAIEEGRAIYDFVDEHTDVEAVGIVPSYQDEGYLLVPDAAVLRVVRYAVSIFTRADERYRSLRTALVDEVADDEPPHALKRFLVDRYPDLPNPATYRVATELHFPVEETMLPVAKRKLLHYLTLGGATGRA
jgi:hypothetical protein